MRGRTLVAVASAGALLTAWSCLTPTQAIADGGNAGQSPFVVPAGPLGTSAMTVLTDRRPTSASVFIITATSTQTPWEPGTAAAAQWVDPVTHRSRTASAVVDADGAARFVMQGWKPLTVAVAHGSDVQLVRVQIAPSRSVLQAPRGAPRQQSQYVHNTDPAARGAGANPRFAHITRARAATMRGLSWHAGCVPFSTLAEIHVNYWGIDGYRYRGVLIASTSVARRVAAAFVDMYNAGIRFHSMHPVDRYGRNPRGPGADDYASMRAGNTSMFNCRYVVGKESLHARSPHATGRSLDINPWENPYIARTGVFPNRWWLNRSVRSPLKHSARSTVVRIVRAHGGRWGAYFGDYQHFDF